ncbi:nicotinamidase-related amidase [Geothermobacter ehrlichii]|uniref:Nicotinamidase-related amidase n=1 Tax=Geothermobacter ehrlichii TaxID=213224 RepID=A0A5D3WNS3_9BACT|nr:isochorismatase family protein [Geothermobacter ehrlichii]TYO99983.1 nicotinamidase-related amidase [Geothermobacter ehrlichii]
MAMLDRFKLDPHQAVLLVVDVQEKLAPTFPEKDYRSMLATIDMLLQGAAELKMPVVTTEQYPQGLGPTVAELERACAGGVIEKTSFGCCGEPAFGRKLRELGRSQVIVTGVEAHICVYQTVLGLLESGYHVHLVRDGICSRIPADRRTALGLARAAGATVTCAETVLFQLVADARADAFKAVSKLIRQRWDLLRGL